MCESPYIREEYDRLKASGEPVEYKARPPERKDEKKERRRRRFLLDCQAEFGPL